MDISRWSRGEGESFKYVRAWILIAHVCIWTPILQRTYLGVAHSPQMMNLNFAREVLATAMGSPERAVWKNCVLRPSEEALSASLIRTEFDRHCSLPAEPTVQQACAAAPLAAR